MARFGDGENGFLVRNKGVPTMQQFDKRLQKRLLDVFMKPVANLLISIHNPDVFDKYLHPRKKYGSAWVSRPINVGLDNLNFFLKWQSLWENRDIVIVNFNPEIINSRLFRNAKSKSSLVIPRRHCFNEYDEILLECEKHLGKLFLLSAGMTGTVLAYDLTRMEQQAIDIGKIAFEYAKWNCESDETLISFISQDKLAQKHKDYIERRKYELEILR
jgi:hypothetical protein